VGKAKTVHLIATVVLFDTVRCSAVSGTAAESLYCNIDQLNDDWLWSLV
jgi:hypothetical protein